MARAAAAAGQPDAARRYYRELLVSVDGADADLPALREARAALAGAPVSAAPSSREPSLATLTLALAALTAIVVAVAMRGKKEKGKKDKGSDLRRRNRGARKDRKDH